jgi:hypothetical protein
MGRAGAEVAFKCPGVDMNGNPNTQLDELPMKICAD